MRAFKEPILTIHIVIVCLIIWALKIYCHCPSDHLVLKEQAFAMRIVIVIFPIIFGFKEPAYTILIIVVFLTIWVF